MTVEEFLQEITIEYDLDGKAYYPDKYKLTFEYEEERGNRSHFVTEYVFNIDINHENKTIKFKG